MTQILLYRSENGVILATDSRAVVFDSESQDSTNLLEVQKLFPLGSNAVAVTGGAGFGVLLCQKLQRFIGQAGLADYDEIIEAAPDFLRQETESFRKTKSSTLIRSDLDRVYIVIAGYDPEGGDHPFRVDFFASENEANPMHSVEIPNILAIPRQLSLECRMANMPPSENALDEAESLFESFLLRLAEVDDEVGPPFHFVRIASNGLRTRTR